MQNNNFLLQKIKLISKKHKDESPDQAHVTVYYFVPTFPAEGPSYSFHEDHEHLPS